MINFKRFALVDDLQPLGAQRGDAACFAALMHVIADHYKQDRFVISLAHDHGVLPAGHRLVEYTFPSGYQIYVPTPINEINPNTTIQVGWALRGDYPSVDWDCHKQSDGTHTFKGMPVFESLLEKAIAL